MDALSKRTKHAFNLGPGEPVVVGQTLESFGYSDLKDFGQYPPIGGNARLIDSIRIFLEQNGYPHKGEIVITQGAKQALAASIHALGRMSYLSNDGKQNISHLGPYWPTLKSIVELQGYGLSVVSRDDAPDIVTCPNNPDGSEETPSGGNALIWDAAYASKAYGWSGYCPPSNAAVFSMAKMFGVPGLRIGWVITDNEHLAELVAEYVEVQTSGVSDYLQRSASTIIDDFNSHPEDLDSFNGAVSYRLVSNQMLFDKILSPWMENRGANYRSMYYWGYLRPGFKTRFNKALKEADVGYVSGTACGVSDDYYRFNMAQQPSVVRGAAKAIAKHMEKRSVR